MIETPLADSAWLWPLVERTTHQALNCGALQPIATQTRIVDDCGIPFLVRIVDSLVRKERAQQESRDRSQPKSDNPFLPYEEALFVAHLAPAHLCLLNKFNVVDHHLLIITREYASQQDWLTPEDFIAFARCAREIDGLGFYNSGPIAGASQHHKHLQLVPFSKDDHTHTLPINPIIQADIKAIAPSQTLPSLPFRHRIQPLTLAWSDQPCQKLGLDLYNTYRQLIGAMGISLDTRQPGEPYNLLMTRDWMMVVGRSRPGYENISVNSLGYAGWLLVKTTDELEQLRQLGPMSLLTKTGLPPLRET